MATTPNYQGMFLRGYGVQQSWHWGGVWHGSGDLGQIQGDAIRNIIASWAYVHSSESSLGGAGADGAAQWHSLTDAVARLGGSYSYGGGLSFDASRVVPTDFENRPVNMAVRYLVRAAK